MSFDQFHVAVGINVPVHVKNRILALLEGDPVFITGAVEKSEAGGRTGTIAAFSATRVARAQLSDSHHSNEHSSWSPTSTVNVSAWRRSDLSSLEIASSPANADDNWIQAGGWPTDTEVTLHYRDGQEVVVAISAHDPTQAAELDAFLTALENDLNG